MMKHMINFVAFVLLVNLTHVGAQTTTSESSGITIIGDQELPQVLYIVPWKTTTMPTVTTPKVSPLSQQLQIPCQQSEVLATASKKTLNFLPCDGNYQSRLNIDK